MATEFNVLWLLCLGFLFASFFFIFKRKRAENTCPIDLDPPLLPLDSSHLNPVFTPSSPLPPPPSYQDFRKDVRIV